LGFVGGKSASKLLLILELPVLSECRLWLLLASKSPCFDTFYLGLNGLDFSENWLRFKARVSGSIAVIRERPLKDVVGGVSALRS
jgi:hypothetical protein